MKLISVSLILIGIAVMFFPGFKDMRVEYQQKKLLEKFAYNNAETSNNEEIVESYNDLTDIFGELSSSEISTNNSSEVIAKLSIEKIDLLLPVLKGASKENLDIAAGFLEGSTPFGRVGNTAVAAHRSHTDGKLFNRLGELIKGDTVSVTTNDKSFSYQITDIKIVKPEDTSVLALSKNKKILTLITCHPIKNPTHRLIIHAEEI
ncbi:class D sortase [Sutcliffiella horikoshii]|uniref:Class D sortase n=1 Tax=Sutcliffiella horikoshii TaxID=79883 RepID=A0A5D4TDQ5_9BACI|nr:class D sortase [Sutcliffiella horikoshii]TYS72276.1 class D sortase [Sutcliffiella horikoshii]